MNYSEKDRIISLDIMRGISIFGIFLVNMLSFHSPFLYLDPLTWWEGSLDHITYILIDVLAQGSFYPLFSLLFGYGLVLLHERTLRNGEVFKPIALRRLFFLLVIGIIHAVFIWHGDILINYAIIGFLLLLMLSWSAKGMMVTGSLLWAVPNILFSFLLILTVIFVPSEEMITYDSLDAEQSVEIYQQGSFVEITGQRVKDWYAVNNPINSIFLILSILPLFLIGGAAAKFKWMERTTAIKKPLSIGFIIFLTLGLFIKLIPHLFNRNLAFEYIQDVVGGPLLAIAYALGIALLVETSHGKRIFAIFAPVGRMSMSNYLFQSIISTLLFYSYGLGLYDRVSVFTGTVLVFFIYILQIIYSNLWLKNHVYGPVEWLWRSVTYKKKPSWKRL